MSYDMSIRQPYIPLPAESPVPVSMVKKAFDEDLPRLVELAKSSPAMEHWIGQNWFHSYAAKKPGDLADFIWVIHEHPPFAQYVKKVVLTDELDGPHNKGLYDLIAEINDDLGDTNSIRLRDLAGDFHLASMGDYEDVPMRLYLNLMASLLYTCFAVKHVALPQKWYALLSSSETFKIERTFPRVRFIETVEALS